MEEKHRQAAVELIEWLQDHPHADAVEQVAEVARRLSVVELQAAREEANKWAQSPLGIQDSLPCVWES